MKRTKLLFAFATAALTILIGSANSNAQTTPVNDGDSKAIRLGIGLSAGLPSTDGYKFAFGGDLRLQQDFASNVSGIYR